MSRQASAHGQQLGSILLLCLLAACTSPAPHHILERTQKSPAYANENQQAAANEIVMQAMSLLDTGYRFGGRNPEAGLDCSGMVSLIVERVTGRRLPHNAAQIAAQTREISLESIRPGDFVFFNTLNSPYSHMGIYLGEGRFIHAPSSKGRVRLDTLEHGYFSQRLTAARSLD